MLGLFSSRNTHPLADAREVRRIAAEIPSLNPEDAIHRATACFESLADGEGLHPDQCFDGLRQIDEAALPQVRRLGREYLDLANARARQTQLWQLNRDYWDELARAYGKCLAACAAGEKGCERVKAGLGLLCSRLLAAHAGRLKWSHIHCEPIDGELWRAAGGVYLAAGAGNLARRKLTFYPGSETTPEDEYLKLLVFHASSMDNLQPAGIEVAERLIARFLPHFVLTAEVRPDNVYWVDAAKPLPPTRLARLPEMAPTLRFFSTGRAADAAAALRLDISARGALPADAALGGRYAVETVLSVLDHLAMCWSPKPPMRSHARHRVESRLRVVNGVAALRAQLLDLAGGTAGIESWSAADVSQGGLGATVPAPVRDWVRVGALLGMQPEGGDNWLVGIVRRFSRDAAAQGTVGIETLSKTPRAIIADGNGLATEGILLDPLAAGAIVRVLLSANAWESDVALRLALDGVGARLQPAGLIERGEGFVLGRYTVGAA